MKKLKYHYHFGSGCVSVGRMVASISRGLRFESSHRRILKTLINCQLYRKYENKRKRGWEWQILKVYRHGPTVLSLQFVNSKNRSVIERFNNNKSKNSILYPRKIFNVKL